eukprot:scaffold400121_cov39-Prasinocladus_malaysianus.AAC.1
MAFSVASSALVATRAVATAPAQPVRRSVKATKISAIAQPVNNASCFNAPMRRFGAFSIRSDSPG